MAVSIEDVTITPSVVTTGQTIVIKVTAQDVSWETIKTKFSSWNDVKTSLSNWNGVKNYVNK